MTLVKMEDGSYIVSDKIVEVKKQITEEEGKILVIDMNDHHHVYFSISINDIQNNKEYMEEVSSNLYFWELPERSQITIERAFNLLYREVDEAMTDLTQKILM